MTGTANGAGTPTQQAALWEQIDVWATAMTKWHRAAEPERWSEAVTEADSPAATAEMLERSVVALTAAAIHHGTVATGGSVEQVSFDSLLSAIKPARAKDIDEMLEAARQSMPPTREDLRRQATALLALITLRDEPQVAGVVNAAMSLAFDMVWANTKAGEVEVPVDGPVVPRLGGRRRSLLAWVSSYQEPPTAEPTRPDGPNIFVVSDPDDVDPDQQGLLHSLVTWARDRDSRERSAAGE
ncbi:hypothetical protein [Catenulispora pinisilvae]|uniref:hypothetical protein n=1 Tax=Catenulispora pinisilvae TaxID=2705253 RepID=UPI0018914149|nr:hypothetical protein [Catenulispora pinisilvae]